MGGLALALPQYKKQDKGQQGQNLDNEGPNQDNKVKLVPSFDSVKEAAENELKEDRDNQLEQDPMFDAVKDKDKDEDEDEDEDKDGDEDEDRDKDDQEPKKCAKEPEKCCHIRKGRGEESRSERCKKVNLLHCCEEYYCNVKDYTCRKRN